jgi:uncharacterized protein
MSSSPFKVLLRDLPTHRHIDVSGVFVSQALAGMTVRDALEAPPDDPDAGKAVLDVDLYADGTSVFANGTMKGHVRVACGRCVGPVDVGFDEKIRVTYLPKHEMQEEDEDEAKPESDDEGVELEEEDLDLFPYEGEAIDLEPLVREQVILAVPYAPLCREDCKGLCPQCGVDLNTGSCRCEKPIDPRFEALKGLKLPS